MIPAISRPLHPATPVHQRYERAKLRRNARRAWANFALSATLNRLQNQLPENTPGWNTAVKPEAPFAKAQAAAEQIPDHPVEFALDILENAGHPQHN